MRSRTPPSSSYAVHTRSSGQRAGASRWVTASASTPPHTSTAYRWATASKWPTRNAPCHSPVPLCASGRASGASVTNGPGPCRVVEVRTTPSRSTSPSPQSSATFANVVVDQVVYGCQPRHSSSSTPCAPSKTQRPSRSSRPVNAGPTTATAAPNATTASTTSSSGGASSGPYRSVRRSRTAARRLRRTRGVRTSPARGASAWSRAYSTACPNPTPHDPCRAPPRRRSRSRFAARCHGVPSRQSASTVSSANGLPSAAASAASASGSTTTNRVRWVVTPAKVPDPNCANVWCRPPATTLCAACAPPLQRRTARTPPAAHSASTTVPLPASP